MQQKSSVERSLQSICPSLALQWHPTKNGDLSPDMIRPASHKKILWKDSLGHEWSCSVYSRTSGSGCPYCSGRLPIKGQTDLATTNPALASEWHPTKNLPLMPDEIKEHSNKKVWWICSQGHEWQEQVNNRSNGNGCPYCAGKKVLAGYNDLQTTHPELAAEWHPVKNGTLTPDKVSAGAEKKVWWMGKCGHEWQSLLYSRKAGRGCPVCRGLTVLKGFTDLASQKPEIAAEWHPTKNKELTPDAITVMSEKKIWWKCVYGHEWRASVSTRSQGHLLISEDDKRQYWQKKTLFQYDENAYSKLLQYYPAGLLRYCYEKIRQDPMNHMDMVSEVLNAVLASGYKAASFEQMEDYELKEMMNAIDKLYYTDEWGRLSKELFVQGVLSELTEGGGKYFIYHPDELIMLVNSKKDRYYYISRHFSLPPCVYNEPDKLRIFAKVLVMEGLAFLLGDILGLSIPGTDGFFPHDTIRELLEEINNDDVNRNIVVTYINNQNAHAVTDGSELKEKANSFFEAADRLEISYHHTAAILRSIGQDYMRESKWDYLYSEIEYI